MDKKVKVYTISLGCVKNLVDTETMLGLLQNNGFLIVSDQTIADVIIINTCAFINPAKKESIRTIFEFIGSGKKLIVCGCLVQRYINELREEIPQIDGFVGTGSYHNIINVVKKVLKGDRVIEINNYKYNKYSNNSNRLLTIPAPYSYLKIAEGCNHKCSFCIIPKLRGKYKSKLPNDIVNEANFLIQSGIKEINLIAQDITQYGYDLKSDNIRLFNLLNNLLERTHGDVFFRLLYAYPSGIEKNLLELMRDTSRLHSYLDIPLQHSHPYILRRMKRPFNEEKTLRLLDFIRENVPDIVLRSTFIVGFPGETEEHFSHLVNFIKTQKFDHVGVFIYSDEEGTLAFNLDNKVKYKEKQLRKKILLQTQQEILKEKNKKLIGKVLPMIIEGSIPEKNRIWGRTYRDAPEVDGLSYSKGNFLPGDIVNFKIRKIKIYDTYGEIIKK